MIQLLLDNPLLLLFLVAAIGYAVGEISVGGTKLGVAAVLFVGLGFGALHRDLKLPEIVYELGLVVFVYTIGLSSGRMFFQSFKRKGLRDNLFVLAVLSAAALLVVALGGVLAFSPAITAGLFTGSLTNTAALAGVLEYVKASGARAELEQLLAEPVVAFSITYPMGVVGMIAAIILMRRVWRADYAAEANNLGEFGGCVQQLQNRTIRVTRPEAIGISVEELVARSKWNVVFGRMKRDGQVLLTLGQTRLAAGDLLSVVGPAEDLDQAARFLGEQIPGHLAFDRSEFDYRRVFVSSHAVAGRRLRELDLPRRAGAIVTRLRRGDIELLPHGETVLELGDRVRVVARRADMDAVSAIFGDSYRALSEIDMLTFSLGLALGLLAGMIPIPLPGGAVITLGFAGGPLIVSLILGALERTGRVVWQMPYSANLTLRQIGLILFLAGIGTRSGYAFVSTLAAGGALPIFLVGGLVTFSVALVTLWAGYRLFKIPLSLLIGMLAGLQTQPAVLGFALEQTGNDLPNLGYTAVYPVALIAKIILAQLILALLW